MKEHYWLSELLLFLLLGLRRLFLGLLVLGFFGFLVLGFRGFRGFFGLRVGTVRTVGVLVGATGAGVGDTGATVGESDTGSTGAGVGAIGAGVGDTGAPEGAPEGASESSAGGGGASDGALVGTVGDEAGFRVKPPPVNFGEQSQIPPCAGSTTSSKDIIPSSEWVRRWQCTAIRPWKLFASYRTTAVFEDRIMIVS